MTWLTRVATLLLAILVMGVVGVFLGFLWSGGILELGRPDLLLLSSQLEATEAGRWIATGVSAVVLLLALGAAIGQWTGRPHLITVRSGERREPVLVPTEQLAHHVADAALATEHVESARASVTPDGQGSVAVALDLRIDEDAEAGSVVSAVDRRVASTLEARYGIRMSRRPNVEVRHVGRRHRNRRGETASTMTSGATAGPDAERAASATAGSDGRDGA